MIRSVSKLLLLASAALICPSSAQDSQVVLAPSPPQHAVDPAILAALEAHADPVDAFVSLHPEAAAELAEPRLLHVAGEKEPRWMTEGDKMRLRRRGSKFADITAHEEFYAQQVGVQTASKPCELQLMR